MTYQNLLAELDNGILTVTINRPKALNALNAPIISNVVNGSPSCQNNDGSISITASGGTGALQYSIDNGLNFQASSIFNGLSAGTYTLIVEDASSCSLFNPHQPHVE